MNRALSGGAILVLGEVVDELFESHQLHVAVKAEDVCVFAFTGVIAAVMSD
jgi:hypothetical protein